MFPSVPTPHIPQTPHGAKRHRRRSFAPALGRSFALFLLAIMALTTAGCGEDEPIEAPAPLEDTTGQTAPATAPPRQLARFPLDDTAELTAPELAELDPDIKREGVGAMRIVTEYPRTIPLVVLDGPALQDLERVLLTAQAELRTEGLGGPAYLEMWCVFRGPGDPHGEYFSRSIQTAVQGDSDWTTQTAPFRLERGQTPDEVRVKLVLGGAGVAWVDDLRLFVTPLE